MTGLLLALAAAAGTYLLYTSVALGWRGLAIGPATAKEAPARQRHREWLVQAGLGDVQLSEFAAVMAALFVVGAALAFAIFGGPLPAVVAGIFAASFPLASYRIRRRAASRPRRRPGPGSSRSSAS